MKREVADLWCERGVLVLVLAILVFGPLALGALDGWAFSVIEGLTLGVVLLWAARLWLNPRPQLLWPPICWAVLAFALYAIARYLTADIEYVARQELLRVLIYVFLFFAILNNLHRQEATQVISLTLVFLAMAISFYAIYQFVTDSKYVWFYLTQYPHRGSGTYICPNHTAGFLELLLPLGLAYAVAGRLKHVTKVVVGYAALVIVAGIAATVSRGGWISTGTALLVLVGVLTFHRSYRLPAVVLLVLIVGAGIYFVPRNFFVQTRLKQLAEEQGKIKQDMRLLLWQPALRMWLDHPWWGVGPGHFDARFRQYRPEGVQLSPIKAHNDYLNTLADWGLAGGLLAGTVWVLLGVGIAQTWRSVRLSKSELGGKSSSNKFAFVLGGSLGLIAILIHSLVDFNLQIPANAILTVTLMALLSSHLRFVTEKYWITAGAWTRVLASAALLSGGIWLGQQSWRSGWESVWLYRAEHEPLFSHAQVERLTRAFTFEPANPRTAFAIGEALQNQSREGGNFYQGQEATDYRQLATEAMSWFTKGIKLNPWDCRNYAGCGWCLDWLERPTESGPYFDRAEALDPNNYFNLNNIGLHHVQAGNYAAARPWFERSLRLEWNDNPIARSYLVIANTRLLEAATNEFSTKLDFQGH